jgi:MFS family permease
MENGTDADTTVPQFGRNVPYIATFALYVILALPASLVDNFGGLMVLRFLLGLFGSPCLANGGASMGVCIAFSDNQSQFSEY